jgi:hypothetical protein
MVSLAIFQTVSEEVFLETQRAEGIKVWVPKILAPSS